MTSSPSLIAARLRRVNELISVIPPLREADASSAGEDPRVVVLFGWMDAKIPHLLKYAQGYELLYPTAAIVIAQAKMMVMFRSPAGQRAHLRALTSVLAEFGVDWTNPEKSRGLIVHTFSNGGGWNLAHYSNVLKQQKIQHLSKTGQQLILPPMSFIFDSCPGAESLRLTLKALVTNFPNIILRVLFVIGFSTAYFLRLLVYKLLFFRQPYPGTVNRMRQEIGSSTVLPWSTVHNPRRYIYSHQDVPVPGHAVESHAAEIQAQGHGNIRLELFKNSPHVAHLREDPERYWKIVSEAWSEARKS